MPGPQHRRGVSTNIRTTPPVFPVSVGQAYGTCIASAILSGREAHFTALRSQGVCPFHGPQAGPVCAVRDCGTTLG